MNEHIKKLLILSMFTISPLYPMLRMIRTSKSLQPIKITKHIIRPYLTIVVIRTELFLKMSKSKNLYELAEPAHKYLSIIDNAIEEFERTKPTNITKINSFAETQLTLLKDVNFIIDKHLYDPVDICDDPNLQKKLLDQMNTITQKILSLKTLKKESTLSN